MTPIETNMARLLRSRQPPKTFCPSELARALTTEELRDCGVGSWREAMPQIRVLAWELRSKGELEITQKGEVLGDDVGVDDVKGPIRIRRKAD